MVLSGNIVYKQQYQMAVARTVKMLPNEISICSIDHQEEVLDSYEASHSATAEYLILRPKMSITQVLQDCCVLIRQS